ncbi:MAG: polysaccharide biosynthesis tyrosine autokinase [Calditrichaeota bacterium]|nr:polysaccharide biosynthesis tyrosine autokinase [Calditrichota bacterium]
MENNFDFEQEEQQISLQDYLRILYRGRWIILSSFLIVLLATAYFTFTTPPVYEASAKIMVESQGTMERALFNVNYFGNQTTLITNQVEILRSRALAEQVVRTLESASYRDSLQIFQPNDEGEYMTLRQQVTWIQRHMEVAPHKESDIIEIRFQAGSPFEAAKICNVIAETYRKLNREFNRSEFRELRQFLERQLREKGEELRKSEEALKEYREKQKLVSLDDATQELISRLAETQAQMEATLVELEAALEQKKNLERQLEERKKALSVEVTQVASPVLMELQREYARKVSEKVTYETLIAQEKVDPQVYQLKLRSMNNQIKAIRERLKEEANRIANTSMIADPLMIAQNLVSSILELETQIKGYRAKIEALRDLINKYEARLALLPGQALELARLQRQLEVDQNTYILMTEKLEETKISEAGQKENVRIVDMAIEPLFPIKPKKKLNLLLGALIGLGLGIGLTFMIEYFDNSIKNPDELERMGFPILAIIPEISTNEISKKIFSKNGDSGFEYEEGRLIETRLVTHFDPKSPISEAYRTLRTNLQFKNIGTGTKARAVLVTSSAPKEGKSTTVSNLAITMAQMGSRTLLVDTDLRRPVIHSIFNLKKDKGITNYLLGKNTFEDVVKPTIVDNLFIVTSGPVPPNPSEILASDGMREFIQTARENFDMILFDSPPVIAVTDAAVLSAFVDGLVLVIKAHQTQRDAIRRTKHLLDNVNATILGCLLNSVQIEKTYGSYYYYYYYHYYNYYGADLKRRNRLKIL